MARGDVLEVGIGTGESTLNFLHRNRNIRSITGIDNHKLSLEICRDSCVREKVNNVSLVYGRGEELPFPDNSFDTVISQFSLCAIEDPVGAVKEMVRVARGRVILVEHGLSYWTIVRWLGFWTSLFPDPQHPWSYGCYQNRDILAILDEAGVKVKKMQTSSLGHVYMITLGPSTSISDNHEPRKDPNFIHRSHHHSR